jgi:hypothetical protein
VSFKPNKLKYHAYFLNSVIVRRPYLTEEKIENVLTHYEHKEIQENGRISFTGYDFEAKKYLKVIVEIENEKQIIFNAYFNRNFKGRIK